MQQIFVQPQLERHKNTPQQYDNNMLGNIGDLFVKCMRQVTKGHLYHLLGAMGLLWAVSFVKYLQGHRTGI